MKQICLSKKIFFLIFFLFTIQLNAQILTNQRLKYLTSNLTPIKFDTISILNNSLIISDLNNNIIDISRYKIDYQNSTIIFNDSTIGDVKIMYKVADINYAKKFYHKDTNLIVPKTKDLSQNKYIIDSKNNFQLIEEDNLSKEGSIARAVNVGNNQDLSLDSELSLKMNGEIAKDILIKANISDENLPIQSEGNTTQIQEFDNVYIELYNNSNALKIGDIDINNKDNFFMQFEKKVKGIDMKIANTSPNLLCDSIAIEFAGAISKGIFYKYFLQVQEANQGPYKLQGKDAEGYIIILAGTERVYIDGVLVQRGENQEYTIDYNTAEITFTAKQPITKDKRISVEFQYAQRFYPRFMFFNTYNFYKKKNKISLQIYTEKDAKNQPLQIEMTEAQKKILSDIGDNINLAFAQNVDSVAFNSEQILYRKTDTIVNNIIYKDIYVHSTSPQSAFYLVSFSYVGENMGSYVQEMVNANGRVFKWTAPVNNILQGNYEAIIKLVAPISRNIVSLNGEYVDTNRYTINYNITTSKYDINNFAKIDKNNDKGLATKFYFNKYLTADNTKKRYFLFELEYNYIHKNFVALETLREVEFDRQWNISNIIEKQSDNFIKTTLIYKKKENEIKYNFAFLNKHDFYNGYKNNVYINLKYQKTTWSSETDYLFSKSKAENTDYIKNICTIKRNFYFLNLGSEFYNELNYKYLTIKDSLSSGSFRFEQYKLFLQNKDSSKYNFYTNYIYRTDYAAAANRFVLISYSNDYNFGVKNSTHKKLNFNLFTNFRQLEIADTVLSSFLPENTLTSFADCSIRFFKSSLVSYISMETSSGQEQKKEIIYVQVNAGDGLYKWIDYNNNNINEIDEFEIANFTDEANYIRIFRQSNNYIKTYKNKFIYTLTLSPKIDTVSKFYFLSKINNMFSYSLDEKSKQRKMFFSKNTDNFVVDMNHIIMNTLIINKSGNLKADYVYQYQKNKLLLLNGIESRQNIFHKPSGYFNCNEYLELSASCQWGKNIYEHQFFTAKNYVIDYITSEFTITNKIMSYKIDIKYIYTEKYNLLGEEKSFQNNFGIAASSILKNSSELALNINYIKLSYNSDMNTSLSYIILDGLQSGNNFTWSMSFNKDIINNLQMSILYSGRYMEKSRIVHSGSFKFVIII